MARISSFLAVLLLALAPFQAASGASSGDVFVSAANAQRAAHGLPALQYAPPLGEFAASWAAEMASSEHLSHNPALKAELGGGVTVVGENVGDGGSADAVETAFEHSPEHLANILDPAYNEIGSATAQSADGRLWVAVEFRRRLQAPPTTAPQRPTLTPEPTPAPPAAPVLVEPHFTG